jgi:thiol:disulfide interchange protein DsbC
MKKIIYTLTLLITIAITSTANELEHIIYSDSELNFILPNSVSNIDKSESYINDVRAKLKVIDKNAEDLIVENTLIKGYYKITNGDQKYYVNEDVTHMFLGDAVMFVDGLPLFLGESLLQKRRRLLVQSINDNDGIIFRAKDEKDRLYVFTDITCPYCNGLHRDVKKINEKGITLVYLPFPRSGLGTNIEKALNNIWCKRTKEEYHNATMNSKKYISSSFINECNNNSFTKYYYNIAKSIEIKGTPLILNKKGEEIGGYKGFNKFIRKVVKTW